MAIQKDLSSNFWVNAIRAPLVYASNHDQRFERWRQEPGEMKTSRNFVTEKMGVAYLARMRQCDVSPHVKPGDGSYLCSNWWLNCRILRPRSYCGSAWTFDEYEIPILA